MQGTVCTAGGGSQLLCLKGTDPGEGIKKRLGAFRPNLSLAGQVSLLLYVPQM
jgi:hypothetical protein